jgi:hypothetical protein
MPAAGAGVGGVGGAVTAAGGDGDEAGGDGGGDEEGEPMMEPEKVLRNEDDKDEILFEGVCKLFRYSAEDKEWKDTGKGTFRVTMDQDTKKRRMLVRNGLGKIIFNAAFFKTMKIERQKKDRLSFAAVVDQSGTLNQFALKLKESEVEKALEIMKATIAAL